MAKWSVTALNEAKHPNPKVEKCLEIVANMVQISELLLLTDFGFYIAEASYTDTFMPLLDPTGFISIQDDVRLTSEIAKALNLAKQQILLAIEKMPDNPISKQIKRE